MVRYVLEMIVDNKGSISESRSAYACCSQTEKGDAQIDQRFTLSQAPMQCTTMYVRQPDML